MVAIKGSKADQVCAQPSTQFRALLIYGPNLGLVRERAKKAVEYVAGNLLDTFRVCEIDAHELKEDPIRLADELAAISFGGGRRAIWLKNAGDKLLKPINNALETESGDTLLVVESGMLAPKSSLRKVFEKDPDLASVPCYEDDTSSLRAFVKEYLASQHTALEDDAMEWVIARLGSDRMLVKSELEKLITYCSNEQKSHQQEHNPISLQEAAECVGDSSQMSLELLADAVGNGELTNLEKYLSLALNEGIQPITIIRAISRRFTLLHYVVGLTDDGESLDKLINSLRPPIFFKRKNAFRNQTTVWTLLRISQALDILMQSERECKTTGLPGKEICSRALLRIGSAARSVQRQT